MTLWNGASGPITVFEGIPPLNGRIWPYPAARRGPCKGNVPSPVSVQALVCLLPLRMGKHVTLLLLICLAVCILKSGASSEIEELDAVEKSSSKSDAFIEWLTANGAKMDYLEFVRMKGRGITAVASSDLGVRCTLGLACRVLTFSDFISCCFPNPLDS